MSHNSDWLAAARLYVVRYGLSVIPMGRDKRPMVKWAEYQDRRPSNRELMAWPHVNLAIVTGRISNLVVVDCESREDAVWFWRSRGTSSVVCRTRRGFHLYFRHPGFRVKNARQVDGRYDVRGDGGYVLAPPSRHSQGEYEWVLPMIRPARLPVFRAEWRPELRQEGEDAETRIRDGARYIAKIKAVAGQGGHDATYRAVCTLKEAGYSEAEALLEIQGWNKVNADPPWSDRELLHKIREVYSASDSSRRR